MFTYFHRHFCSRTTRPCSRRHTSSRTTTRHCTTRQVAAPTSPRHRRHRVTSSDRDRVWRQSTRKSAGITAHGTAVDLWCYERDSYGLIQELAVCLKEKLKSSGRSLECRKTTIRVIARDSQSTMNETSMDCFMSSGHSLGWIDRRRTSSIIIVARL